MTTLDAVDPRANAALDPAARECLETLCAQVASDPVQIRVLMPAAARLVGRGPLDPADPQGLLGPTLDDAVRGALLVTFADALARDTDRLVAEIRDLYRFGDADEKRAVLRVLHRLTPGPAYLDLVADALRTNDVRLVAAALGPYGAKHLDAETWRQGVLKCLFVGVPLSAVAALDSRSDALLADMIAAYVYERVAAGRDVPADVWQVLDVYPQAVDESGLLAELDSPYADRRAAAEQALAGRTDRATTGRET
jgi:hypothetical protein